MKRQEKYILNSCKIKDILPFYIADINDKFFTSLNNHPSKFFTNKMLPKITSQLNQEELEKFLEIDNLTKTEKIRQMLNLALTKIISKTGSYKNDLFEVLDKSSSGQNVYILENENYKRVNNYEDTQIERRYNFFIKINPTSYLYQYLQEIQLSFYLDEENKILTGGFSLNLENSDDQIEFNDAVEKIYLRTLIRNFISKQLYPIALDNILELFEDYKPNEHKKTKNKKKKNLFEFEFLTINDIKNSWVDLINRKYLKFQKISENKRKYYEEDLFFSIMTTSIITLSLYEELRIYFTHKKPELILSLLSKPQNIKEDPNQNPELDFYELSKFLRTNYFEEENKPKIDLKKSQDSQEIIDNIAKFTTENSYESFGFPIASYEIYDQKNKSILSETSLFKDNEYLKILYLLAISPELFGMDLDSGHFIEYQKLVNTIKTNQFSSKFMPSFYEKLEHTNCEINYNFISFVSNTPSMLIVTNEKIDVYHDYLWSQIYAQSLNWIRMDIEYDFYNDPAPRKNAIFYQEKIHVLENLMFQWNDEFYGLPQIKPIVFKIDQINHLKDSVQLLIKKIWQKDQTYKKDTERTTLVYAFLVAALIGFNNFFGMVFTILTVSQNDLNNNLTSANIAVISVSTIIAFIILLIAIFYIGKFWTQKSKLKKEHN